MLNNLCIKIRLQVFLTQVNIFCVLLLCRFCSSVASRNLIEFSKLISYISPLKMIPYFYNKKFNLNIFIAVWKIWKKWEFNIIKFRLSIEWVYGDGDAGNLNVSMQKAFFYRKKKFSEFIGILGEFWCF